jgi:uncharacterized cupredoxin-like copper-binding protein
VRAFAAGLAAVALLAACGGGAGGGQPAGSIKVTLTEYKFDSSSIDIPSGKAVFFVVNGGSLSHDMVIRDSSKHRIAGTDLLSPGDSAVLTVDSISAGKYTYLCDQPGHEGSGMSGTLTVT